MNEENLSGKTIVAKIEWDFLPDDEKKKMIAETKRLFDSVGVEKLNEFRKGLMNHLESNG